MMMEGDLTWGGEHTIQYTDDVLCNCKPETYVVVLTHVVPINSIKRTFLIRLNLNEYSLPIKKNQDTVCLENELFSNFCISSVD